MIPVLNMQAVPWVYFTAITAVPHPCLHSNYCDAFACRAVAAPLWGMRSVSQHLVRTALPWSCSRVGVCDKSEWTVSVARSGSCNAIISWSISLGLKKPGHCFCCCCILADGQTLVDFPCCLLPRSLSELPTKGAVTLSLGFSQKWLQDALLEGEKTGKLWVMHAHEEYKTKEIFFAQMAWELGFLRTEVLYFLYGGWWREITGWRHPLR